MLSLEETLSYKNDRVVNKFRTFYDVSAVEAQEISLEAYRWLWLNAQLKQDRKENKKGIPRILVVHIGMVMIDEFWHNFVFHTQDYEAFCTKYFGTFIHHNPGTVDFQPLTQKETELQLNYIWDVVGEKTIARWYEEYPVRYSPEILTKLQKPRQFGQPCEALTS